MDEAIDEGLTKAEKKHDIDVLGLQMQKGLLDAKSLPRTASECLRDELSLFSKLPSMSFEKAVKHVEEHPWQVVEQFVTGAVIGATIAAAVKNPGILGKSLSRGIMVGAESSAPVFLGLAAADWAHRIGAPMVDVWNDREHLSRAQNQLAQNVGSGLVDYTAGAAGGLLGAKLSWHYTPEWQNVAPAFDRNPSLSLGEKPRPLQASEAMLKTVEEKLVSDDVVLLYEKSFPLEERQPVAEIKELVDKGRIVVHTTRDGENNLKGFSFTSMHDETTTKFANLDFIATQEEARSQGLGSLHFSRLRELIGKEHPELSAMTLEMEHPKEAGINDSVRALREYRSKFYDRLDTPDTNIKFTILDFEDPSYRGPAQWRAWVYKPEDFNAVETARTMYMDEGGYGIARNAPPVREFDRANNYWEAPFAVGRSGLYGSIISSSSFIPSLDYLQAGTPNRGVRLERN